jgi:5'-nucleotidase
VSSWAFSGSNDVRDTQIQARIGDTVLGTFAVDNSLGTASLDEYGTATIDTVVPASVRPGERVLRLVGDRTGTEVTLPITVALRASTISATSMPSTAVFKQHGSAISVTVGANGDAPTGTIVLQRKARTVGSGELVGGTVTIELGPNATMGQQQPLSVLYRGDDTTEAASTSVTALVAKPKG